MNARNTWALSSLLLLAALTACSSGGGGGGGGMPQPPPPPPPPPPPTSVTQTIGAAGGTINGPLGVVVTIPPDALEVDTQITVSIDSTGAPSPPTAGQGIGSLISVTPHGTVFGVPITISMPFDAAQLPAGANVTLIKTNAAGDGWQELETQRNGNTLTAAATGFSYIGVHCCIQLVHFVDEPDDQTAFEGGFAFFRAGVLRTAIPHTYQWYRNGLIMPGETNPEILIPRVTLAHDNSLYMVRASASGTSANSRAARLLVSPQAPVIVNQPLDAQIVAGQRVQFFAASTSSVTQTVRWQSRSPVDTDFHDIQDATTTVLSFVAAAGDDGVRYRMCATNITGESCSRGALLSVIYTPVTPTISQQPQPQFAVAGSSATFTVYAVGGGLSYEWQRADDGMNFAPITGATSASYTLSNALIADDGAQFQVRVFNSVGTVLSSAALLTVRINPGAAPIRVGGGQHSIGLRGDGTLRAWGPNNFGQLGDGTFNDRNDAVDVIGLRNVATLSVGAGHTLAIRTNGEVWAWGHNGDGQLGDGTTDNRATAQPVPNLAAARAVAASRGGGRDYSLAVLADGTVRAWGNNDYGQLGDGTVTDRPTPVQVGSLTDVIAVSAGVTHSLALRSDGSLWAWGANNVGQLGNGTTTASLVPIAIPMPAPIVAISAGGLYSLALTDEGSVLAWGVNSFGGLGDGTTAKRTAPIVVPLPVPAAAVAAALDNHSLALLADGRVYAWGANAFGQCGQGTDGDAELLPRPVIAPLPTDIVAIGVGINHSLALDSNGTVWGWGSNFGGALNDGTSELERATPVPALNVNLN